MPNVKYFGPNRIDANSTYTLTSAPSADSEYLYDNLRTTKLISSGSDDMTNEDWVIELDDSYEVDSIFIDNHNIASGSIQYWNGSAYVDFSTAISYSSHTNTTDFHQFDAVTISRIRVRMSTTQVANAEKFVGQLRLFNELGEMAANPETFVLSFPESSINHKTQDNKSVYVYNGRAARIELLFSDANVADVTLLETLKDLATPFYVFPGGGTTTFTNRGWRIQDMFFVNYTNEFRPEIRGNILGIGEVLRVVLEEA